MKNKFLQFLSSMRRGAAMLLLLFMCVTHAWADSSVNGGDVYFDAGGSGWSVDNVQFVIGHGSYSNRSYSMTAVQNTLLYYYSSPSWNDASYFAFASGTGSWSDDGQGRWSGRCSYATKSTTEKGSYNLNSGNVYVFKSNGTDKCDDVESGSPYGWQGDSYTYLNKTITVAAKVSTDGGANYSSAASPGTLTASSYSFTNNGNNCKNSTSLSEGTITCGYTANTTLTAGSATGYTIEGWYDGNGDKLCNNSGTINPRATATVYAYYTLNQYTVSYGVNSSTRNGSITLNSGSSVSTTSSSTLNHGTSISFTASPSTGYQVEGWYSDAACSSNKKLQSGGTSYDAGTLTAAITVYVKFEVRTGGTVTLSAGTGGQVSLDNSNWGSSKAKSSITTNTAFNIYAQASIGYTFSAWAKSSGSGTITSTSSASTTFTPVAYEDATVTASFNERMSTLTTSCAYDAGTPGYSVPSKSVSSIGIATTADVIATAPGTGYTFAGWTLTHCVRTDDNGETSRSITIRSDGSGSAATAQANYEEVLTSTYYLVGNNTSVFPGDAIWTASDSKNMLRKASGSSTGDVGSITIDVKSIPANNSDYQFKIHESSANKWWGWGKDDSYYWMNGTKTTSLYNNEHNLYFIPNALGDYTFSTDWTNTGEPSLTVTFPATTYTVNFGQGTGTNGTASATYSSTSFNSGTKVQNGKSITLTAPSASSGYTWDGWYNASSGGTRVSTSNPLTTIVSSTNYNFYARYTENQYNATVSAGSHGSVSPSGTVAIKQVNGTSITATPDTHYAFTNWTISGGGITPSSSSSATQVFKATSTGGTITANFVDKWAICGIPNWSSWNGLPNSETNVYEGTITLAAGDHTFKVVDRTSGSVQWYGKTSTTITRGSNSASGLTAGGGDEYNMTITADVPGTYTFTFNTSTKTITVTYPTAYTVTYGAGTINGSDAAISVSPSFTSGDYVLPETDITFSKGDTKDGYTWKGWYSNVGGTGVAWSTTDASLSLTDTRTGNISVYACYTLNNYTITYNLNGGTNHPSNPANFNVETSTITLQDPTKTGYTFRGWYTDAELETEGSTIAIGTYANQEFWAKWEANTYTITLNQNGATTESDPTSLTATYDATAPVYDAGASAYKYTITNPEKTGYTFAGWFENEGGAGHEIITQYGFFKHEDNPYVDATGHWKHDGNVTVYAKWTPNNYTVTLSCSGETGYGSSPSGVKESVSATYGSAMPTMGTAPTPAPGYKFMGYFLGQNGTGVQYYAADGSSLINWTTASNTTLYAYFRKTEISSLEHPEAVATGETVYVVVNPVLNQDGAQNYMDICWSLLYDTDTPVDGEYWSVESWTEGGTKQNQVRFTLSGMSSGYYKIQAVLRSHTSSFDACDTGTELSTIKSDLRIAGNSKVTIQYEDASDNTIAASTSVEVARGDSIGIKAPSIIGYAFTGWELGDVISNSCKDDATCDLDEDSINIKAAYDGYLTAKYRKKNMVYFNNTLDWEDVYVYFYNDGGGNQYWADGYGTGANQKQEFNLNKPYNEGEHGHMTQIEGTNIWYFDYEAAGYTTRTKVSFANVEQSIDKSGASNDEAYFHNASVVYRTDFDLAHLPMFVPINSVVNDYTTNTGSKYYRGYWMNYPESTGYVLKIFDNTGDGASLVKERNFEFSADKAMPMSVTVDLEGGNKTYGFKIYRVDDTWFSNGGTMTNGHSGDTGQAVWGFGDDVSDNCGLTTTSAGNYTFTLDYNSGGYHQVGVHYPESTGDFRVMYIDDVRIANHGGAGNEGKSWLLSSVIPSGTESDTISYFVRAEGSKHPKIKIQKCTVTEAAREEDKEVRWADQGDEIEVPGSITKNGVYNFIFTKVDGALTLEKIELYEGNFYIRVDGAGSSNWDNFRAADHLMPYSDYSLSQTTDPYSHYYMKYYETKPKGGGDTPKNIKFVVANDYSACVSDTIIKDGVADDYVDANGWLSGRNANIRFMYNYKTNVATRRYLDDAQGDNSTNFLNLLAQTKDGIYLVAEYGEAQTNIQFADKGDWIYEKTVYAVPGARYKLRAQFGVSPGTVITQWFKGDAGETAADSATLIGGSGSRLPIRLIYDFKTNRIVTAYQPLSGTIDGNLEINADIMFMREHQGDIQQITFAPDKSISKIENIYCGLRFNKWTLNNKSKAEGHATLSPLLSRYERDIFYVSFPYDVRLSDVIGFGTYGQHWIVEYYDGAARAKNGFWIDSDSYWKFVTPSMKDTFTLKAGTGYIVALDLDELYYIDGSHHADIWNNTETNDVELLFPGKVSSISDIDVTYNMPRHQCTIDRGTTAGNRTIKDSHWNVLGVPTFKNIDGEDSDDGGGNVDDAIRFTNTAWIKDTMDLKFIYDGNLADNSLTPKAVKDFEFKAMHAYVVQYCGDVTFTTSNAPAPSPIVARSTYAEAPQEVDFRLELNKDGVLEDQTFVSLSNAENASADFQFGEDMSKEFNSNRANIYTFIGTEWVAGNTLPLTNQTTIVPVGVKIAADGEYTFSIPEGTYGVGITLIDNEAGARVNLGLMDYTVTLAAGQIDDRFVLEISPISQISTDVESVTGDGLQVTGARKIMIDGLLYIVKDGVVYDAQGRRL